jgi:hypothetical protein
MTARHIPYAVGIFMLFPLVFWFVMSGFVIPGTGMVIDSAVTFAMLAVSMPLVAWFYIANLSFLSNNIGGDCEFAEPRSGVAMVVLDSLPWFSLSAGFASIVVLRMIGEPWPLALLPFGLSMLIAGAILLGEHRRTNDAAHKQPVADAKAVGAKAATPRLDAVLKRAMSLVFHVPVFGWMLRDAIYGRESARSFFAVNILLLAGLAVWVFGYPAVIVIALAGVPLCFAALVALTWE